MGELFALSAALCYGITHFFNGLLARRAGGVAVAFFAQVGGTVLIVLPALLLPVGRPTGPSLAWGALSGVGAGLGMAFLYRGLSKGRMSVVVPVSDVNAAILPVLIGIAVFAERPSAVALCGIAVAFPAIWLVSRSAEPDEAPGRPGTDTTARSMRVTLRTRKAAGVPDGLVAGAGVALTWVALAQVPAGTGLWPLVVSRAASVAAIVPLVVATRTPLRVSKTIAFPAAAVGAVGTFATLLYMLAAREQLLAIAAVLSALYPVIPVLLAVIFLRERVTKTQTAGLTGAGAAISLIASQ